MAQATGIHQSVLYIAELAFNQLPTINPGDMVKLPVNKFNLGSSQNHVPSRTIRGRRDPAPPSLGNIDVTGEAMVPLDSEAIGYWLKHLCGAPVTTGSGPYVHTFKVNDTLPSASFESGYPDPAHYSVFTGNKVESLSLDVGGDDELEASINIMGAKEEDPVVTTKDSAPSLISSLKKFNNFQATVREGGVTIGNIRTINFEIRNNMEKYYLIGGGGFAGSIIEGLVEVDGKIEATFDSPTLYDKAIQGTETSIELTFTNGAHSLVIDFPEVVYERAPLVQEGPAGVFVDLPFKAFYDNDGQGSTYVITLTNDLVTY